LASLVRQIHHSRRAYPLMDLANMLIHDAEGYLVKIEVQHDAADFTLFQCKRCKAVTTSEEMMVQHLMAKHLPDLYEKEEIETEPPAGQFICVARCRKSGVLLGPPNHHSYTDALTELHQSRFAHLPLEEYKCNIETVRDEELIEQWKEQSRKKTVYRLKSDPEAEPVELRKAEVDFKKEIPAMYETTLRAVIPSKVAQGLDDRDVSHAIRRVWTKESRFPLSMSFAMRAAFRHMHLYLFKAGKINFVTHIKPHPVKPADTIESIAEVLVFLKDHPGSTRAHLLEVLHPSVDPASKEAKAALQPLGWLIERGHIIEFFNGTLSVPLGRRR
jgi:predicted metal-binding protein